MVLLACIAGNGQSLWELQPKWSFGSYGIDLGFGGMVKHDMDGNGRPEIFTTGAIDMNARLYGFFSVIEYDPAAGSYATKWLSRTYFHGISALELVDTDGDGSYEILLGFENGEIRILNGRTYEEKRSVMTFPKDDDVFSYGSGGVRSLAWGDIDNNGTADIVAGTLDTTYVYTPALTLIQKIYMKRGGRVALANVDNDPFTEAIYSGGSVMQFQNGQSTRDFYFYTESPIWTRVRLADMNKDGITDVLNSVDDSIYIWDVASKQALRELKDNAAYGVISDFQVYDYTGDGIPELFVGNDQFDGIVVYDGSGGVLLSLDDHKSYNGDQILAGELDGIPGAEILFTSGTRCSCNDFFYVYDLQTEAVTWQSKAFTDSFRAFDTGIFEAGGEPSLVVGNYGEYKIYDENNFLTRLRLSDLKEEKAVGKRGTEISGDGPTALTVADVDGDHINEILFGIETYGSYTYVYITDSDFNVLRKLDISGMGHVTDIVVTDTDGNGTQEIIVTSGVYGENNYVYIFDGTSGDVMWRSDKLGGSSSNIANIRVGNVDNDAALEIMFMLYSSRYAPQSVLYILDGVTHELSSEATRNYGAFDLDDFDHDGILDVITGTTSGELLVLDGQSLEVKKTLATGVGDVSALRSFVPAGEQQAVYIFADHYRLRLFDQQKGMVVSQTDTLSHEAGIYGTLRIAKQADGTPLVLMSADHAVRAFGLGLVTVVPPADFVLLAPQNGARLQKTDALEFVWEPSVSRAPVTYTLFVTGPGTDLTIPDINKNHVSVPLPTLQEEATYTWHVTAVNPVGQTGADAFSFQFVSSPGTDPGPVTGMENADETVYKAYPNPFEGRLIIRNESAHTLERISLTDSRGVEQLSEAVSVPRNGEAAIERAVSLPPGLYLCRFIANGDVVYTSRLIKR